jgi:hypothetical protein
MSQSPPTTFPLFPQLPSELRLKIWSLALSSPRTVTISCKKDTLNTGGRYASAFTTTTPPPAPLHTCREARYEGLTIYKPYFTVPSSEQWTRYEGPSVFKPYINSTKSTTSDIYTYLNFDLDTVRCADNVLEYIGKLEINGIRRLVLEVRDVAYFGHFCMDVLKSMSKLKELGLWTQEGNTYSWSRGGQVQLYETLERDFMETRYGDPGWECPRVRIVNINSGEEMAIIEGGALIPGWKYG